MNKKILVLTFAILAGGIENMQASCGGCDGRGYGDHDCSSEPVPLNREGLEIVRAAMIANYKKGWVKPSQYRDYRGMSRTDVQWIDDERNKPENGGPLSDPDISRAVQKAILASVIPAPIIPAPITVARTEEEKYRDALKLIESSDKLQDYAAALAAARKQTGSK